MNTQVQTRISKKLSLLLRHQPELYGLHLDEQGWCSIEELLAAFAKKGQDLSLDLLLDVVAESDKKRFSFSPDGLFIRANQGHSVEVDLGYAPQQPPAVLYHGTADRFLPSILNVGILKGKRHHVHLSLDVETATKVGERHGRVVILQIDAAAMHADGHTFYCSDNGVWLVDEVPIGYFRVESSAF